MSQDLTKILQDWQYDPDEVMVRLVKGDDGREKIQLRVDLGVLQMELDGRPDGLRPEGCDSWLEYYEQMQRAHDAAHPDAAPYLLSDEDCARLWREGVQYYHRYLSFWHLSLYHLCARDTQRNLRLFAFVCAHTQDDRLKLQFDQWRPYVTMMYARSLATPLIERQRYDEGLQVIESAIDAIRDFLDQYQQSQRAEECVELVSLERWRDEIFSREEGAAAARPHHAVQMLRRKLDAAVAAEEFEEAARLRDEIRRLNDPGRPSQERSKDE
jgi:hypothetical protein